MSANPSARLSTRRKPPWARRANAKPKAQDRTPLRRLKDALRHLPEHELLEEVDDEACAIVARLAEGTPVPAADYAWAREWLGLTNEARQRECAA